MAAVHHHPTALAASFWLLPDPEAAAALRHLSAAACRTLTACTLPPHITLVSDRLHASASAIDRLHRLAEQRSPVLLSPSGITATDRFTQSLILRFTPEAERVLQAWVHPLRDTAPADAQRRFDPHLSLLYSQAPLEQRQSLAARLQAPEAPLRFDQVSVVSHPAAISSPADIAAVSTLAQLPLS